MLAKVKIGQYFIFLRCYHQLLKNLDCGLALKTFEVKFLLKNIKAGESAAPLTTERVCWCKEWARARKASPAHEPGPHQEGISSWQMSCLGNLSSVLQRTLVYMVARDHRILE